MDRTPKKLCEIHSLGAQTREWLVRDRQVAMFRACSIRVAGHTEARRGYAFVRRAPAFSQILACTAGHGQVLVDGRWATCTPGTAYVTAPHALCAYRLRPGDRWNVCWVIYEEAQRLPTLAPGTAPKLVRMDAAGLQLAVEGLCHEATGRAEPAALELWGSLVHRQVLRTLEPEDANSRLAPLWQEVNRNLAGEWNLQRMAILAGMSAESLRRMCRDQVRRSPLAHVTYLRMRFAADLLACTPEKVSAIANRVGYADPFAFSNAFKREMGCPPSEYRSAPPAAERR